MKKYILFRKVIENMYNFTKPGGVVTTTTPFKTIFNGQALEDVIPGFVTLSVKGRALIGREIESNKTPGADGKYLTSNTLDPRPIVVKYLLKNTSANYRENFNKLNLLLHKTEPKQLKFTDEPDYYFNAFFESADEIDEIDNNVVATISFLCLDPYKYKNVDKDTGTNRVTITKLPKNPNECVPVLIKMATAATGDKVIIKNENTTKKLVINHKFAMGDVLEIDLNADYILKLNSTNKSDLIDFVESDFDFTVKQGDVITSTNSKLLEVHTKERLY